MAFSLSAASTSQAVVHGLTTSQAVFPDAGVSRTSLRQAVTVLPPHPQEFLSFSPDYFDKH
jgi:hypothetical protein